jgi:hypothetical protein
MRKDDLVRLRHMLDAAREAVGFVRGLTRAHAAHQRRAAAQDEASQVQSRISGGSSRCSSE